MLTNHDQAAPNESGAVIDLDRIDSTDTSNESGVFNSAGLVYQDLSAFTMPKDLRGRSAWFVQIWWLVQDTLFRWSPTALFGWRSFLLRLFGAQLGRNVRIRPTARVTFPWKLTAGNDVWVGDDCVLYNLGEIRLGSNVALAHQVYLCTGLHDYKRVTFPIEVQPIIIEDEVWLTNDVFVAPGVTVSRGAVVGARSTVLHDLPGGMVCFGSPAKPKKRRQCTKEQLGIIN